METVEKYDFKDTCKITQWLSELETQQFSLAKTRCLLVRRSIPQMLFFAGLSFDKARAIYSKLAALQDTIYPLDSYGESVWQVSPQQLQYYWKNIMETLAVIGLASPDRMEMCSELLEYQDIEISRRRAVEPSTIEIGRFYYLKTSDVRLSRRLAVILSASMNMELLGLWNAYDALSEVIDDLEDQTEDSKTFNANRFLISCKNRCRDEVLLEYSSFISSLGNPASNDCRPSSDVTEYVISGIRHLGEYALHLLWKAQLTVNSSSLHTGLLSPLKSCPSDFDLFSAH